MQRLTTWEVRACTPTKVAAERVGLGCGWRVDVEHVETDGLLEEQRSKIVHGIWTEYHLSGDGVSAERGESGMLNV